MKKGLLCSVLIALATLLILGCGRSDDGIVISKDSDLEWIVGGISLADIEVADVQLLDGILFISGSGIWPFEREAPMHIAPSIERLLEGAAIFPADVKSHYVLSTGLEGKNLDGVTTAEWFEIDASASGGNNIFIFATIPSGVRIDVSAIMAESREGE